MALESSSAHGCAESLAFFKKMPKIELHAHLNGSVSQETLKRLAESQSSEQRSLFEAFKTSIRHGESLTLDECFQMFKLVHQIVNSKEALYVATSDVIREFAEDNVVYLELRSTPRANPHMGLTKRTYLETILKAISDCSSKAAGGSLPLAPNVLSTYPIVVRLVISIDRRGSIDDAMDTVCLASELLGETNGLVVGVDLSGDGTVNDARDFIPVLQHARSLGLKLAVHAAEVAGHWEETAEVLKLAPERIGHGTFIHPLTGGTTELFELTRKLAIPLELCLASNIKSEVHPSYYDHHFKLWFAAGHPVCICTDDKGVFMTSLSEEYMVAAKTFGISRRDLWELTKKSVEFIFAEKSVVQSLNELMCQWESTVGKDLL